MYFGYNISWDSCNVGFQLDWSNGLLFAVGLGPLSFAAFFGDEPPF